MGKYSKKLASFLSILLVASLLSIINTAPTFAASGAIASGSCTTTVGETATASISQVGNDCVVTFNSGSNSWTAPTDVREINLLVVAGGGAGGRRAGGVKVGDVGATYQPNSAKYLYAQWRRS